MAIKLWDWLKTRSIALSLDSVMLSAGYMENTRWELNTVQDLKDKGYHDCYIKSMYIAMIDPKKYDTSKYPIYAFAEKTDEKVPIMVLELSREEP